MAYGLIYFYSFILMSFLTVLSNPDESSMDMMEMVTILIAFCIYLTGTVVLWWNERNGALVLMIWNFIVWLFSLFVWIDAGMVLILVSPMLIPAVFLYANWQRKNYGEFASDRGRWGIVLKTFLMNYAALYFLIIIFLLWHNVYHVPTTAQ